MFRPLEKFPVLNGKVYPTMPKSLGLGLAYYFSTRQQVICIRIMLTEIWDIPHELHDKNLNLASFYG